MFIPLAAAVALNLVAAPPPATRAAIDVKVIGVTEFRQWGSVKPLLVPAAANLTLSLSGERVREIHGLPQVRVYEARDDRGTNLTSPAPLDMWAPGDSPRINVPLSLSARDAKRIALFHAEVDLRLGGTLHTLTFKDFKSLRGTHLSDPVLSKAGIEVAVNDQRPPQLPMPMLQILSWGKDAGITEARLLNSSGGVASRSSRPMQWNGNMVLMLPVRQAVTDAMGLQLDVWTDTEPLTLAFEIKDISLP